MAASSAACAKEEKFRTGIPNSSSVESAKEKSAPNIFSSITAEAVDTTLWPLGYSGKGDVCRNGVQAPSIYWLIYVSGRMTSLRYFSSQQLIKASAMVSERQAYTSSDSITPAFLFLHACAAILIQ